MSPEQFSRLIAPQLDVLHRLARRLARTRADAEDLAQEALIRAFERRDDLRDAGRIRPWLLALTRNVHLNRVRDQRPNLLVLSGSGPADTPFEPTGNLEEEIQATSLPEELLVALHRLPEDQATAIWLREVEGLAYDELAEAMGTPIGTVRSRLARARSALQEQLSATRRRQGGAA